MTTRTKKCRIPHGVVFLYNPTMIIDVPDDTGSAPILHTASCISIWTIEEDVGEVCLTLADEKVVHHGQRVFEGMLETNGRRIAFNESGVRPILELTVANTLTKISLFANHRRYPDAVTCLIDDR